jgi:hypothetical protein
MNPEPMNTGADRDVLASRAKLLKSVFMGSGFAALPRPGMTRKIID